MTDFVSLKRNLATEKERLEKLGQNTNQKLAEVLKEIENALIYLDKTETSFKEMENNLNNRKKDEIDFQNQKKTLLSEIESLREHIERINISIKDEDERIAKLEAEISQLNNDLALKQNDLSKTERTIGDMKSSNKEKNQEKEDIKSNMEFRLSKAQQILQELEIEKEKDMKVSPILDFLLKEVRIDIPEVEILSVLAYRNQAMGIEELKQAASKTPPVIILKVIRNLDSKGIIKYDERLDTIEIIANLV
ncbi:MAG: hypothetical protein HZR80_08240 [Candidatus Heimdallarchaeota archaeon]